MHASSAIANENTPAYFWAVLRAYIEHAFSLFGAPSAVAKKLWLSRDEHKLMSQWLRACEQILRKLIFIDALKLTLPAPRERKQRAAKLRAANAPFDAEDSSAWRVSFKLLPLPLEGGGARGGGESHAHALRNFVARTEFQTHAAAHLTPPPAPSPSRGGGRVLTNVCAAAPLARRLEALIRGFNAPSSLARRAARLLQRNATRVRGFLKRARACDAHKPGFAQADHVTDLARDAYEIARGDTS
jgi:hypothetical protein